MMIIIKIITLSIAIYLSFVLLAIKYSFPLNKFTIFLKRRYYLSPIENPLSLFFNPKNAMDFCTIPNYSWPILILISYGIYILSINALQVKLETFTHNTFIITFIPFGIYIALLFFILWILSLLSINYIKKNKIHNDSLYVKKITIKEVKKQYLILVLKKIFKKEFKKEFAAYREYKRFEAMRYIYTQIFFYLFLYCLALNAFIEHAIVYWSMLYFVVFFIPIYLYLRLLENSTSNEKS